MKPKHLSFVMVLIAISIILTACGQQGGDNAGKAVEIYLQALVAQDATRLTNLSCKDWEKKAVIELDSFQAVKATLENLSCKQGEKEANDTLVRCQGKIAATYNNEKQEIELSLRTYRVRQESGEWRVCGYK